MPYTGRRVRELSAPVVVILAVVLCSALIVWAPIKASAKTGDVIGPVDRV